jgi:hypothetical protein
VNNDDQLFWHGGRGACYSGAHWGFARQARVHADGELGQWGHCQKGGVDTGVYCYDTIFLDEAQWQEQYQFWFEAPGM